MTRDGVSDEQYGQFSRRVEDLKRRVLEGSVNLSFANDGIQHLIERKPISTQTAHSVNMVTVDLWEQLEPVIRAGYYGALNRDVLALFPREVQVPEHVIKEFPYPMLVDAEIDLKCLSERSWVKCGVDESEIEWQLVSPLADCSLPLKRYVAFCTFCGVRMPSQTAVLTYREAVHFCFQHRELLMRHKQPNKNEQVQISTGYQFRGSIGKNQNAPITLRADPVRLGLDTKHNDAMLRVIRSPHLIQLA